MIDLSAALSFVVDALDSIEAEYVVVGSGPAAAWGVARSTRDIDPVTVVPAEAADAARDAIESGSGSFNVLHPATGGKVDVFVASHRGPKCNGGTAFRPRPLNLDPPIRPLSSSVAPGTWTR